MLTRLSMQMKKLNSLLIVPQLRNITVLLEETHNYTTLSSTSDISEQLMDIRSFIYQLSFENLKSYFLTRREISSPKALFKALRNIQSVLLLLNCVITSMSEAQDRFDGNIEDSNRAEWTLSQSENAYLVLFIVYSVYKSCMFEKLNTEYKRFFHGNLASHKLEFQ